MLCLFDIFDCCYHFCRACIVVILSLPSHFCLTLSTPSLSCACRCHSSLVRIRVCASASVAHPSRSLLHTCNHCSRGRNYQEPGQAPGNPYGQSTITPDFRPRNSPAEIIQIEPNDLGYLAKHLIKLPSDKKVIGRIAGRPDPAKNRPYGRSPSGTVPQPF